MLAFDEGVFDGKRAFSLRETEDEFDFWGQGRNSDSIHADEQGEILHSSSRVHIEEQA